MLSAQSGAVHPTPTCHILTQVVHAIQDNYDKQYYDKDYVNSK